jgi:hypothetical protein
LRSIPRNHKTKWSADHGSDSWGKVYPMLSGKPAVADSQIAKIKLTRCFQYEGTRNSKVV